LLGQSALSLATALLLILSFPAFEFTFLAWVAIAPLLRAIAAGVALRRAFWLGWLEGVVFTFFAENWIAHSMVYFGSMLTVVAYAIAFLFASVLAVFPALFAASMSQLMRSFGWWTAAFAPIVWVATEWLRQLITGVTWNALGVSQVEHFAVAKLARFGGVYLISAVVVAGSALIVLLLRHRDRNVLRASAALTLTAAMLYVLPALNAGGQSQPGATVTVVGVQPNLPPDLSDAPESFSRELENLMKLTREGIDRAPGSHADIVVWAESPLALFYENDRELQRKLDSFARETGSYFIINSVARDARDYFNSVNTISPREDLASQALKRYDKIRLVPFGEYVPWRSALGRFVPTIVGDFTPGREAVVNALKLETIRLGAAPENGASPTIERTTNFIRVGAFICYEAAYPDIVRRFPLNGATLLVNVSNDAWFGTTAGARQHLQHAMIRAIETDRNLVRVTNTGVSALITPDGVVVDPLPVFSAGAQVWQAQARSGKTFYVQRGDWFAISCVVATLLVLTASIIDRFRPAPDLAR
jgi:apolipoprotein N-acyltransferase